MGDSVSYRFSRVISNWFIRRSRLEISFTIPISERSCLSREAQVTLLRIRLLLPSSVWCHCLWLIHVWNGRTLHGEICVMQIHRRQDTACFPMDHRTKRKDRPWNEEWNEACLWKGKDCSYSIQHSDGLNMASLWISPSIHTKRWRKRWKENVQRRKPKETTS